MHMLMHKYMKHDKFERIEIFTSKIEFTFEGHIPFQLWAYHRDPLSILHLPCSVPGSESF